MRPTFVDTHCHFDFPPFHGDETRSLQLAQEAGIEKIIAVGVSAERFAGVMSLAERFDPVYAALGIHPMAINDFRAEHLQQLEAWLQQRPDKLVAIGEIGLDLFIDNPQFDRQEALLDAQLRLARQYNLPVILHSRRTHDKLAMHLRRLDLPRRGVVHGFAGSEQQALAFIKAGYFIGVGGTMTYERASKTRRTLSRLPLSSLLLETDSPDMPVQGFQGEPNRPERINNVWQCLCDIREESPQDVAEAIRDNTRRLFHL
ncbi:TatD family hydrolase [Kushneria marisflavi]|uniref:Metal-dependent hydrolase n=1 Tax=Kushneria marisflavi TaxID=157779 RepID=A0A240UPP1_9GAMM|nr:TatD family hydrolase [Kushneria marisflavi]ART62989.1 metal-dependent hydrolase [Kushneria marisflavi]RKD84778.1 TatD DNase family protein [Kushneria marisflavi]